MSIYRKKFEDENFSLKHWHLAHGKCWTNHQLFLVSQLHSKTEWLDGKQEILAKGKEDMSIVEATESLGSKNDKTRKNISIADYGKL